MKEYRVIIADPPWRPRLHQNTRGRFGETQYRKGPQGHYATMSVDEIISFAPSAAKKSHLYLWAIGPHIDWAYRVARAWGFEPQQTWSWAKPGLGTGTFQSNTEYILVCRKGGPVNNAFRPSGGTHFDWPRSRVHSAKPDGMFRKVEVVSPYEPRLEMYARSRRGGWDVWGDEIVSDVQIQAAG